MKTKFKRMSMFNADFVFFNRGAKIFLSQFGFNSDRSSQSQRIYPWELGFSHRWKWLQHNYMMAYQQMSDKNYLFFLEDNKGITYENISGDINSLSQTLNYLQVTRYLKLLINPFYLIWQFFWAEVFYINNLSFIEQFRSYSKYGRRFWFFDYLFYSVFNVNHVFFSYIIRDFFYYLYLKMVYRMGFIKVFQLFWKILIDYINCKFNRTTIKNIYRFFAFITVLDRSDLMKFDDRTPGEKSRYLFSPLTHLNSFMLKFVTVKVSFKLNYRDKKYRASKISVVLQRLLKRYFYIKSKFAIIFDNFRRKYINLVVQHKALSHLMLQLGTSKDYILWSMLNEILYIYKNKVDKIVFLFKVQRIQLLKLQEKRKKQRRIMVLNYVDKDKMGLGELFHAFSVFNQNLVSKVKKLREKFYLREYEDFVVVFRDLKLSSKKVNIKKYRNDETYMGVLLKRLIWGVSMDLIFLNFTKFKKIKFVNINWFNKSRLSFDWLLSNFIFVGEYRFFLFKTNDFGLFLDRCDTWYDNFGKFPWSLNVYSLGGCREIMDAFVLNYRSLVLSPSKLISNKIVLLLLGNLNLKDVLGFLSYNKYFFKKFSVKSIGMILFYLIYILVLFFFIIGRKIWVFREEIVLSVIELLFYGLLLLFLMWFIYFKYLGVVFVMFILGVSFLFVSFILFNGFRLFYKLLVRILSGEKMIMQLMLLFLVCSTHLYYGLFVLDFLFFRKYGITNKQLITLLGVFLYVRESLFFYLPFYYMRTLGLLDYLGLFFHLMSKFWILSRDMVNVIRNRNRIWFYVTDQYYWNIYFDVYLLFGGYNFIYDYFYDYLFLSKDLLRTTGGVVLFFEIVFELLLNLIFWCAVILVLVLRQLLVFLAYLFVSVYSWFVLYFNVGLNHVGILCRFVWWRIWGFLLYCFWRVWMFFDFFFSFFRMIFSFIFFSEFKYWIWNSLFWNNVIFRLHDDVKFNFNVGFYISHFYFKRRLQSLIWIKYIRLNTKERVIVDYNSYVGLSLKRIVFDFFFYRLNIIMRTYLGSLLVLVKRFLNWVEWTPQLFNKAMDMVLRSLFLIIRVYNNIVLQYMNYNLVLLNYIYSVRDYIWIINWILLTQSGFPFWWRGRLFFSSLKFNRKYFFFSSLVELFEGLNFWTGHYYNASLFFRYNFYFSSMSFFWDVLWARFRVDFTSIFKLFSNEKAVGFFRDFYFYSILPFNLFKTRSNSMFFLDFNFIFNLLDTSLVFNNNLYVNKLNVSKTGVYGIQKVFFFIRSFLKRLIMVFYLPLFVLWKALKFFVLIIGFIYGFMPIVLVLVLINIIVRILFKVLTFIWEKVVLVLINIMVRILLKILKFIWKEIKEEFNPNRSYVER